MTTDEQALAEDNGRLREEAKNLWKRLAEAEQNVAALRYVNAGLKAIRWFPIAWGGAMVLGAVLWFGIKTVSAPRSVDHCEILQEITTVRVRGVEEETKSTGRFTLVGIVPWHTDVEHGTFPNLQDALWAAKQMNCPIH